MFVKFITPKRMLHNLEVVNKENRILLYPTINI